MNKLTTLFWYLLVAVGGLALLLTVLSLVPEPAVWWLKVLHFPRLQFLLAHALVLVGLLALGRQPRRVRTRALLLLATGAGLAVQAYFILPYTVLGKKTVPDARPADARQAVRLRLLVLNVLMENRQAGPVRQLVRDTQPDVLLAMETDAWWVAALRPLQASYPYRVELPRSNTYGLVLYSRLPLVAPQVSYLEHPAVPSIHTGLRLPDGRVVAFHGVHPPPPVPLHYLSGKNPREVTLLKLGRLVKQTPGPALVAGDFNDVSWSFTTHMFEANGELRNVRLGRGLYSSFRATTAFLRWPLDHIFVTKHFRLAHLKRLPSNGSDHFPIYAELVIDPTGPVR